jgi:hypothetical protein
MDRGESGSNGGYLALFFIRRRLVVILDEFEIPQNRVFDFERPPNSAFGMKNERAVASTLTA